MRKKAVAVLLILGLIFGTSTTSFADEASDFGIQDSNIISQSSIEAYGETNFIIMGDPPITYGWDVTKTQNADVYGAWELHDQVKLPMSISYTYGGSVTTQVNGSFSAPISKVEAALGFSVDYTYSWSKTVNSGTYPVSLNGKTIRIKSRIIYKSYNVKQQQYSYSLGVKTLIGSPITRVVKKPYATDWSYNIL